jgi:TonB family protein
MGQSFRGLGMKYLVYAAVIAVCVFGIALGAQVSSQEGHSKEEQARILEECLIPDRPKPQIEGNIKRNAVLCGKATSLPKPSYPDEAKAQKITGTVSVEIIIDEKGSVIWANAVEGHALLRTAAVKAACQARYSPTKISGRPIKVRGEIGYRFVSE